MLVETKQLSLTSASNSEPKGRVGEPERHAVCSSGGVFVVTNVSHARIGVLSPRELFRTVACIVECAVNTMSPSKRGIKHISHVNALAFSNMSF